MTHIEAMKQALEALDLSHPRFGIGTAKHISATAALRQAIAKAEKQEPVAWVCEGSASDEKHSIDYEQDEIDAIPIGTKLYTHPPQRTEQEPVATLEDLEQEIYQNTRNFVSRNVMEWMLKRYYTAPQPQREWVGLTDEEHYTLADKAGCMSADWVEFAKSIEQALKEKNT